MEITLHIGAHRSGSTVVMKNLEHNARALAAEGLALWPPAVLRTFPEFDQCGAAPTSADDRARFAERLDAVKAEKLLISEENIIGWMAPNLRKGRFYPRAAQRLAAYAALLPVTPTRIALGIRNYMEWWSSAYAYFILHEPLPPFEEMIPAYSDVERGWLDLVREARETFPDAEIVVWPTRALYRQVIDVAAWMIGRPAGRTGLKPLRREINTSLGLDAIPALMAARAAHPELTGAPLRRIVQADPASHAGEYRPWGQARETALAERYRAEIAELEAGYCDVRFRDHADMRAAS